jgi:hypothetical protein
MRGHPWSAQFGQDVGHVRAGGALHDAEVPADLPVGATGGDQHEHPPLPRGERVGPPNGSAQGGAQGSSPDRCPYFREGAGLPRHGSAITVQQWPHAASTPRLSIVAG